VSAPDAGAGRWALVTGAVGPFGGGLAADLARAGWRVRAFDGAPGDDPRALREVLAGVDVVFHLAARAGDGFDDPVAAHAANADATLALLEAARVAQPRRVVYASLWQDEAPTSAGAEADAPTPETPRAIQKIAGELYCALYHRLHALETVSLRYPAGLSVDEAIRATRLAADAEAGVGGVVTVEAGRAARRPR